MRKIPATEVRSMCETVLIRFGVSKESSKLVVDELIANEYDGYPSHGLFRIIDYVNDIVNRRVNPNAEPRIFQIGQGWIVDAQEGLGLLASQKVAEVLCKELVAQGIVLVSLKNASHIGRLAGVGRSVASEGHIVLGFCNYRGAGKRMAPPGCQVPLLSTNPLLFACPRGKDNAYILDMSTSVIAEGKVRSSWLNNVPLPSKNWLYNLTWLPTDQSEGLYSDPPSAILSPLGGVEAGYKGFGLAIMVEILAGILTDSEFASATTGPGGNCAFFIGLRSDVFGISQDSFCEKVEQLLYYCEQSKVADGFPPIRMPGGKKMSAQGDLSIPESIYQKLVSLEKGLTL